MKSQANKANGQALDISVVGRNMPVTDPLREYVLHKMSKLSRYLDRLSRVEVVLWSEHAREASRRNMTEASAVVHGRVLRAEAADADMYAAVDALVDKLHLQLTKLKEKTRAHKGPGLDDSDDGGAVESDADIDLESPEPQERIVRVKQFTMKPVFSDEAIDELEESGHAFYVFLNAESEQVSVLYRRRDGLYGLIEPALG